MSSYSYELGWVEGYAKSALWCLEKGNTEEAIRLLRFALDEPKRKEAFAALEARTRPAGEK